MKQSRLMSLVESAVNIAVGLGVAMIANAIILPALGFPITLAQNAIIAVFMTAVSLARSFALRRLFEALHIRRPLSPAMAAVIAERFRQVEAEGWSPEHDDEHAPGELAAAGACYALAAHDASSVHPPRGWRWADEWWKPAGFRRNLVKAAALILAEIEKFDRLKTRGARPKVSPSKGGSNDLSRWKQFGGTLDRPAPPPSSSPALVQGYTAPAGKKPRPPRTGSGVKHAGSGA
jgi:hypothetical protein